MTENHHIVKPRLFISHASSDADFANAVKQEIGKVFANGLDVFSTSSPGAVAVGTDWLNEIETRLATAQAVIAIITPVSIERPWLWFEVGATWNNGRCGNCRIYPLCAPEISLSTLPSPLDRLQALSMGKARDLKILFESLIKQFGFGKIGSFRASNISNRIPKYKDVEIKQIDLNERALYSGRYSDYTTSELIEVIDDQFFRPKALAYHEATLYSIDQPTPELYVQTGRLVHFRAVDKELDLPPGTAKQLLNTVAERYDLKVAIETDNLVRYVFGEKHRK